MLQGTVWVTPTPHKKQQQQKRLPNKPPQTQEDLTLSALHTQRLSRHHTMC